MYLRYKQRGKSRDIAGLYFDITTDGYSYGMRIYKQTFSGFQALKDAIAENSLSFERELNNILSEGYRIIGEKYKKTVTPKSKVMF